MKKIFLFSLTSIFIISGSPVLAATTPAAPTSPASLLGSCAAGTLKYFPQQNIESVVGGPVNSVTPLGLTIECMFSPGSTPDSTNNITVSALTSTPQIADTIYNTARTATVKDNGIINEGGGSCDRFYSASRGTSTRTAYGVEAEKGGTTFGITSSVSSVTVAQLESLIQYACNIAGGGQAAPVAAQDTTQTDQSTSTPVPSYPTPTAPTSSNMLLYVLGGVVAISVLGIILTLTMGGHKKSSAPTQSFQKPSYTPPPAAPFVPPSFTPPPMMPPMPPTPPPPPPMSQFVPPPIVPPTPPFVPPAPPAPPMPPTPPTPPVSSMQ